MSIDGARLLEQLTPIDQRLRVAFAAACATRLLPRLQEYAGRIGQPEPPAAQTLDLVWKWAAGEPVDPRLKGLVARCEKEAPGDDDEDDDNYHFAQAAALTAVYAGEACLTGDPQSCVWAAVACDDAIEQTLMMDDEDVAEDENHPWFQTERARQSADLQDLLAGATGDPATLCAALRRRAELEAETFPE